MKSIFKISILLSLSELSFNLAGYVIHAFMGRFLGPAEYGRFSLIITFTTMFVILIGRGIPISMSKYLGEFNKDKDKKEILNIKRHANLLQNIVLAVITIVFFLLAPVFADLLNDPTLTPLFRISSLIIPTFGLAAFYLYYFNGLQDFNKQSALKFIRSISRVALILIGGYFWKTCGAIIGQALAPLSVYLSAFFLDPFKKIKVIKQPWDKNLFKKISYFAWPVITFMLFYELMISIDLYLIKAILKSDYDAGLYNAALTVGRIPYYVFYFLTILLLPKISKYVAEKNQEKTKQLLSASFRFLFMLLIPSLILLSFFSQSALNFFYGHKYLLATEPMKVLVFGLGFLTVYYILTFVINGAGKNKFPMYSAIIGAVVNTVLNYVFIHRWGMIGSAWATTITAFLAMIFSIIYTSQKITPFLNFSSLIKFILAGGVIYLILLQNIFSQGKFIFVFWLIILLAVYLMVLLALKELKKEDFKVFFNSFKNKQ